MIIGMHLLGTLHVDCEKVFKLIGCPIFTFPTYKRIEEIVGKKGFKIFTMRARKEALQEEINLTTDIKMTTKYGCLPALIVSIDTAWLKHALGRRCDLPAGVLHVVGDKTGKIVYSVIYKNKCSKCEEIDHPLDKMESGDLNKEEK